MPQKLVNHIISGGFSLEQNQVDNAKNKKELASGKEYLQYFQNKHSEKQLDLWIKSLLPVIKSGDQHYKKNSKVISEIMKANVPMCYRGELWQAMIGNDLRINSQIFNSFNNDLMMEKTSDALEKNNTGPFGNSNDPQAQSSSAAYCLQPFRQSSLILKDIPRTFPHLNSLFEEVHSLSTSLKDILGAFNNFRPDIGYVQGMCYLAAMLLIHQTRPETSFISFCNLIHKFDLLHEFYMAESVQILRTYKVFWKLLRENAPILYKNLKETDATCHMFL